jgi:hypothetical protein
MLHGSALSFVEELSVLAQTNDPNRAVLIENAIKEYLKGEPGTLRLSLERLCDAIDREDAERRRGEDWSIAKVYVRSRLPLNVRDVIAARGTPAAHDAKQGRVDLGGEAALKPNGCCATHSST